MSQPKPFSQDVNKTTHLTYSSNFPNRHFTLLSSNPQVCISMERRALGQAMFEEKPLFIHVWSILTHKQRHILVVIVGGEGVMERWDTKSFIVGSEWETMRPFHRCGPLSCQMCHAAILLSTRSLPVSPWTSASMSPVSHISHRCLCYILSSIFWPEFLSPTPPKILK